MTKIYKVPKSRRNICKKCKGNMSHNYDYRHDIYYYRCDNCGLISAPNITPTRNIRDNFISASGKKL